MTQTNLIVKAKHYSHVSPLITIEMDMKDYTEAEDIASKLNDIAKAKGQWILFDQIHLNERGAEIVYKLVKKFISNS